VITDARHAADLSELLHLRRLGELFEHASVESSTCGTSSGTGCTSSWSSSISVHWRSVSISTLFGISALRTGSFGGLQVSFRTEMKDRELTANRLSEAEPADAGGAGAAAAAAGAGVAAAEGAAAGAEGAAGAAPYY